MPVVSAEQLRELSCALLVSCGTPTAQANIVADGLINANLAGHDSHGVLKGKRAIDLCAEVRERLGRDLRDADLEDEALIERSFDRVRGAMQRGLDRLYAERRFPVIG